MCKENEDFPQDNSKASESDKSQENSDENTVNNSGESSQEPSDGSDASTSQRESSSNVKNESERSFQEPAENEISEKKSHKAVNLIRFLEEIFGKKGLRKFLQQTNHKEERRTFNTQIAAFLALSLWTMLGATALWNIYSIDRVYSHLLESDNSDIDSNMEKIDKSSSIINDTAKSLYAVIIPIASTVTAFYFDAKRREAESIDSSED